MYKELFVNKDKMISHLNKKRYEEYFNDFKNEHSALLQEMIDAEAKNQLVCDFATEVKEAFVNKRGKIGGIEQMNLNLFMIYYVFPLLLELDKEKGTVLVKLIIDNWGKYFNDPIMGYMTYEEVMSNFKTTIFGIPLWKK